MMQDKQSVYSNTRSIEELGRAFQHEAGENVTIRLRDCQDVPEFIRQLQAEQEATRNHSIKFR